MYTYMYICVYTYTYIDTYTHVVSVCVCVMFVCELYKPRGSYQVSGDSKPSDLCAQV